ncbi:MAG: helix-turn-helix domain-containing protein, partial [Gammaproteobacteria bacterium]|nr:helix-turn-helix domain-containing protein [Gammaproteobacteria bacterium]
MTNAELKSLRSRLGFTQAALAEAVGVVPNTLARWERGELGIPGWAAERLDAAARSGSSGSAVTRPHGVVLDPHHGAIVDALNGALDPSVFETCAVDLLRRDWPRVVPVAGGGDDGFDGAVADGASEEPFPLVVTTARNLTGNLRENLKRAQRKQATLDRALFATSRRVTSHMRQKLRATAGEIGVKLLQIYEQDWFAQRLYAEPVWCKRLLRLTGRPRALSPFPITRRPVLGDRILGRERETRWLQEQPGDRLLVGAPGSGKTFLLRALVLQGQALFKVDDDREQIANDLRTLKPPAVIIDDAHVDPDAIVRFIQIRQEVGSDVRIIATSWPGEAVAVQHALQVPDSEVLNLELIDADTMIEIIKSVGIGGPDDLLRVIRQQAAGRPGLAATLAHLCLAGDIRRVVSGDELVDQLVSQLDRLVGFRTQKLLAPFALGGNAGAPAQTVAEALGTSLIELSNDLTQLAAAGIVQESRTSILETGDDGTPVRKTRVGVSVDPSPMRWVLVQRVFFGSVAPLPLDQFLEIVSNEADALDTLIGARSRGASIPDLAERLERADARLPVDESSRLWAEYASLGPAEARDVIDRRPHRLLEVAEDVLEQAPETAIPLLLDQVSRMDGSRPEDLLSRDPLDVLAKWATRLSPTREDWSYRRSALSRVADLWRRDGGDARTALRAMCIALNPKSEFATTDPGRGRRIRLHFGTLGHRHVEDLTALWESMLSVLRDLDDSETPWHDLLSLVSAWVHYPFDHLLGIPDNVRNDVLTFAQRLIQDLADISSEHPGLQHELKGTAELAGLNIDVTLDPEFEALHQNLEVDDEMKMMTDGPPDSILEPWERRPVEEMTRRLAWIESEADLASISYPRWSPYLCARLAKRVRDPAAVAERFMEGGLPADLVGPFVLRAANAAQPRWEAILRRCLDDDSLRGLGLYATTTHPEP